MATLTVPTFAQNWYTTGDINVKNGISADNGDGTMYIENGGLYVGAGLTDLGETTITTTNGLFTITGSNKISANVSAAIELTAAAASYFTTSVGAATFSATNTTDGKVSIIAAGNGTDSILINASNATDGQLTLTSAGASTSTSAIKIFATDTTDGDVHIKGSGSYASTNPAVFIEADNSTSGLIQVTSAGDSASVNAISLNASGTTGGNVVITGAGSTVPAIDINASSATSGQVLVSSVGDSTTIDAVKILGSAATNGNVLIQGAGTNANKPGVKILASNATSGQVLISSAGNIAGAVKLIATDATGGGVLIDATGGEVAINTANTSSGITIGTTTAGVPVTIGSATSLTTINGDLMINGGVTTINTEVLTVEDNLILVNSGVGSSGTDAGMVIRRYQTPNGAGTGDVVNSPTPVQESGAFQAGSATPGTLVLSLFASASDDFYNGWWVKVTSGVGIDQVRRIKDYVASTQTATLYVTADNVAPTDTVGFFDGLDLVTAPAAADTYELYSKPYVSSFYKESENSWALTSLAVGDSVSTATVQQYQELDVGTTTIKPQVYNNVFGSASTTTVTFTLKTHGIVVGDKIRVTNSSAFTPSVPAQVYTVLTVPTANTFTITVAASTVSTTASSATISLLETSSIYVNKILFQDTDYGGLSLDGITAFEDIIIPKTSTSEFIVTESALYGVYKMLVADLNNTNGAYSIFDLTSSGSGGSIVRSAVSKGADNQRIHATWASGAKVKIFHAGAGSGIGDYTYRVRLYKCF